MRAFITRQCNHPVSTWQALCAPLWGVERRGKVMAFPTKTACVTGPTMTASESSPSQGQECDGESYDETVRQFLHQRLDSVRYGTTEEVEEVREQLESGEQIDEALRELESELGHLRYAVQAARDALRASTEGDEE